MATLIFLLSTTTPRLTSLLVEEQLSFGALEVTLFSFAHVIIRLSAFSAVVHLLHILQ